MALVEIPKCSQEEAETIPLENVFKVTLMEELAKGKSLFQIMTSNGKFTLGTDSLEESEKWICTLNKELFGPPKWNVVCKFMSYVCSYMYISVTMHVATVYT